MGDGHFHVEPGTLNTLSNPENFTVLRDLLIHHVAVANFIADGGGILPLANGLGTTLPTRRLDIPMAHHYGATVEQRLGGGMVLGVAYVGTQGRNLLRFTTPNLGQDSILAPLAFLILDPNDPEPSLFGVALPPGFRVANGGLAGGRPVPTVGTVNRFETTAESRYDAMQFQVRGRLRNSLQYQAAYTWSKASDDVSDVFDLAGA